MEDQGKLLETILKKLKTDTLKICEVGVYKGRMTSMWNVKLINKEIDYEYYAIDHFKGSREHDNRVDYYNITLDNLTPILDRINIIKNNSIEESENYEDGYFDVVYIDASHDYESVKQDILSWKNKVKKGGILCGDDYIGGWPGVVKAVNECFGNKINRVGKQQWFTIIE